MRIALPVLAALALLVAAFPAHSGGRGADIGKVEECGIPPGDGAYSITRAWGVACARAEKIGAKVSRQFCGPSYERCSVEVGEVIRGHERYRGWRCKLKVGYEFSRKVCHAPGKRFVQESAA